MDQNSSPCELELGVIENWHADIDIGNYPVNRSVATDYRDARGGRGIAMFPKRMRKQT